MNAVAPVQTKTEATQTALNGSSGFTIQRKCACGGSAFITGNCEQCESNKLLGQTLQTKLQISEPGDEYELEADQVADQVMRMPDPNSRTETLKASSPPLVQRKVTRSTVGIGSAPPIVHDVLSSPGQTLDAPTRAFFEPRFGHDFSHVRVHSDARGQESAQSVNALAYTVGNHIVFGKGQGSSTMINGGDLLAHELTHVVQQGKAPWPDSLILRQEAGVDVDSDFGESVDLDRDKPTDVFVSPDLHSAIRDAIAVLNSIRFVEADRYVLEMDVRRFEYNEFQHRLLMEKIRTTLRAGINAMQTRSSKVERLYSRTVETNDDYWPITKVLEIVFGAEKPGEKLSRAFERTEMTLQEAEEALSVNEYSLVITRLEASESNLTQAEEMVDEYRAALDTSAETIAQGALITRNVSVGVMIGIGAVLATPVVAGGVSASVAGAGFSGFTGTTLTTLGTGVVVTGGGGLAGGSVEATVNVVEQALEGEGFDANEFFKKTGGGGHLGATSAIGGATTVGMARFLGQASTFTGQAVRSGISGYAGGAASGGLGATLERKSLWDIAKAYQLGGFEGMIGGVFGGVTNSMTQGRSLLTRLSIETLGGGLSSGLGAAAVGKSSEEIVQSVITGSITSGAVEVGAPRSDIPEASSNSQKSTAWEVVGEDVDFGLVIFRSGEQYVGRDPSHPNRVFIPQYDQKPKVYDRQIDGAILEIPWPLDAQSNQSPNVKKLASNEDGRSVRLTPEQEEAVMHNPSLLPSEGSSFARKSSNDPGLVMAAPVNAQHTLSMVRDIDGKLDLIICSPRCYQLIALLDDLTIRARIEYRGTIESLQNHVRVLIEDTPNQQPLDPVRIDALAGKVEGLRRLIGEEVMFQGRRMPVILQPDTVADFPFQVGTEQAISTLALPRRIAMHAPREFNGNARAVRDEVLGTPPNIEEAYNRVPGLDYHPSRDWPMRGRTFSQEHQGSTGSPVYLTTLRINKQPRMVAVKHFRRRFGEYEKREVLYATILGKLGIGPRVFGVVEIKGAKGLVMDAVAGDFPEVMPPGNQTLWDLEVAVARMADAGMVMSDFQYLVTPDGRAIFIDAGGIFLDTDLKGTEFNGRLDGVYSLIDSERGRLETLGSSRNDENSQQPGNDISGDITEEITRESFEPIPEDITEELPHRRRAEVSRDTSDEGNREVTEEITEELPKRLIEEDSGVIFFRAQGTLSRELENLRQTGEIGVATVEGVTFSGLLITMEGGMFTIRLSGLKRISDIPGRGRLIYSAFEQAAIDVAKRTPATSVRILLERVVNRKWGRYLSEEQSYENIRIDHDNRRTFSNYLGTVFPL